MIGGVFETAWAATMKLSDGFTHLPWTLITILLLFIAVYVLDYGLKGGIPVGSGYSVWVGVGAIGSIIVGIILFGESMEFTRLFFAAMIIVGVIGVEMTSHPKNDAEESLKDS